MVDGTTVVAIVPLDDSSTIISDKFVGSNRDAVLETMGMLCDVLLISYNDDDSQQQLQPLLRGIQRRVTAGGLGKPKLVAVLMKNNQEYIDDAMNHVVQHDFQHWTPELVSRLEIVSSIKEYQELVKEVLLEIQNTENESPVVELEAFPKLLREIYASLSNGLTCQFSLELEQEESQVERDETAQEQDATMDPSLDKTETTSEDTSDSIVRQEQAAQEEPPPIAVSTTAEENDKDESNQQKPPQINRVDEVLSRAWMKLDELKQQQEAIWLHVAEESDDEATTRPPLEHFGETITAILENARQCLLEEESGSSSNVHSILLSIAEKARTLYMDQLESLRNYYGQVYEEALLEQEGTNEKKQQQQEHATAAAKASVEGFRQAAKNAIPEQCRQGQPLRDADYEYVSTLNGLISDMMQATSNSLEEDEAFLLEQDETQQQEKRRGGGLFFLSRHRVPRWLQKLSARVLVMGINYLQGWLAWQGIKKAAEERDLIMPKFPLY